MIWVVVNIHFDPGLLGKFLMYYRSKCVDRFGFITHNFYNTLLDADDIKILKVDESYHPCRDNELTLDFVKTNLGKDDYYISADLDEFYWTPGLRSFQDLIGNWDFIRAKFVDRLPIDGVVRSLTEKSLDSQFPLASSLTKILCGGCDDKSTLIKSTITTNSGHHFADSDKPAPFIIQMHHFKWFDEALWNWVAIKERGNMGLTQEICPFRAHYFAHGKINVFDPSFLVYPSPLIGV